MPANNLRTFGFGVKAFKHFYELIPVTTAVGFACAMGTSFMVYSLATKPDVRLNRRKIIAPWEEVDMEKPQKLMEYHREKYHKIAELDALRKEIGSYKC